MLALLATFLAGSSAQDPIPGYEFMLAGFDIRNASSKSNTGQQVKARIFLESYDDEKRSKRPNTSTYYLVPDQFDVFWYNTKHVLTTSEVKHNVDSLLQEQTSSFHIGIGFNIGAFGAEASYSRAAGYSHYIFTDKLHSGAYGTVERTTNKFNLGPYVILPRASFFNSLLKKIPVCPTSAADLQAVQSLFDVYGQVFPISLFAGGRFETMSILDANLTDSKDASWVTEQLSLKFHYDAFELDTGGFKNRSDIHVSNDFLNQTKTEEFWEGGNFQDPSTLKQWYESIPDMPAIIGGDFRPLTDLITDDATKRKNLEHLAADHINTGRVASKPPCGLRYKDPRSQEDLPPIPGYEFLGGFDSLSQQPRAPVFLHDFGAVDTWENPFYPEYRYAVPRTAGVFDNPESVDQNYTYIATSVTDYQHELHTRVTYKDRGLFWSASHSVDMYVYEYYHDSRKEIMAETMRFITWYDVAAKPLLVLKPDNYFNPWFKAMVKRLGPDLTDPLNKERYYQLFNTYGDQVVTRVSMGVRVQQKSYISENDLNVTSISEFKESSHRSFFGIFGSGSDFAQASRQTSAEFRKKTRLELLVEGGNVGTTLDRFKRTPWGAASLMLSDLNSNIVDWRDFVLTAKDDLQPVSYEVMPLADLIADPVIRENMRNVAREYQQAAVPRSVRS